MWKARTKFPKAICWSSISILWKEQNRKTLHPKVASFSYETCVIMTVSQLLRLDPHICGTEVITDSVRLYTEIVGTKAIYNLHVARVIGHFFSFHWCPEQQHLTELSSCPEMLPSPAWLLGWPFFLLLFLPLWMLLSFLSRPCLLPISKRWQTLVLGPIFS